MGQSICPAPLRKLKNFIRYYHGGHTGLWDGCSALFVKIPGKDLAFIILANSLDLSSNSFFHFLNPFSRKLSRNLKASPFGRIFLADFAKLEALDIRALYYN
jgi:hypothetical protein